MPDSFCSISRLEGRSRRLRARTRTSSLAELIADAIPAAVKRESRIHPATRAFQGIRIAVNDEIGAIERALPAAFAKLAPGGVLAVISFHSLEDRIVKQFIAGHAREQYDRRAPFAPAKPMRLLSLARVKPSAAEVAANPRARSAIMRVAQRTEA